MSETNKRLRLAIDKDLVRLPHDGSVLLLNPSGDADLCDISAERIAAIQPFYPDFDRLQRRELAVFPELDQTASFAASVLSLPREKHLARAYVAQAVKVTAGPVFVDGAKSDGVDALLREVRGRVDVDGVYAKAHGKLFWFDAATSDFSDWMPRSLEVDGLVVRPGVFSADGVDPASSKLAESLPDLSGQRVADLGAGWGYLSAQIVSRGAPASLHLVEANHTALECARQNVKSDGAQFHWADARDWLPEQSVDAVVMNPPFHLGRSGDPELGRGFIANAARILVPKGVLYMVANRHLPYEATLDAAFGKCDEYGGDARFKLFRAERPYRAGRRT